MAYAPVLDTSPHTNASGEPEQLGELADLENHLLALRDRRDWIDRQAEPEESMVGGPVDHLAARLYTSKWYGQTFGIVKNVFRRGEVSVQELNTACFLIELVNIDLYNCWRLKSHGVVDFEGLVHRGLVLARAQWEAFEEVFARDPVMRKFSIPLALDSASKRLAPAIAFIERNVGREDQVPVLKRIHVIGLTEPMLELYGQLTSSKVSTICAAPIRELSDYRDEDEVLIRGGFFHLLRISDSGFHVEGRPIRIVDCVMLNSNRDHFSTPQIVQGDAAATERANKARRLFGSLVELRKMEFCLDYCLENGLFQDAAVYRAHLKARSREFRQEYGTLPL